MARGKDVAYRFVGHARTRMTNTAYTVSHDVTCACASTTQPEQNLANNVSNNVTSTIFVPGSHVNLPCAYTCTAPADLNVATCHQSSHAKLHFAPLEIFLWHGTDNTVGQTQHYRQILITSLECVPSRLLHCDQTHALSHNMNECHSVSQTHMPPYEKMLAVVQP